MTPSLFLLQLAILLLPGVIWAHMETRFVTGTKPTQTEFLVRSLLFGLTSYAITYLVYYKAGWSFRMVELEKVAAENVFNPDIAWQIILATGVGFVLSVLWLYAERYKLLTRFLQCIGATNAYGDEDVWDYTLNSRDAASEYVHFRDFENQLVYAGWVLTFSETGKLREIVLKDVQVHNFEGETLFETPLLYIARKAETVHMEFPFVTEPSYPRKVA